MPYFNQFSFPPILKLFHLAILLFTILLFYKIYFAHFITYLLPDIKYPFLNIFIQKPLKKRVQNTEPDRPYQNHSMATDASVIFSKKKGEDIPHLIII